MSDGSTSTRDFEPPGPENSTDVPQPEGAEEPSLSYRRAIFRLRLSGGYGPRTRRAHIGKQTGTP